MAHAAKGNKVKVHYTGKLGDGSEFDSSQGRDPLEFTLGEGQVIEGFEKAVEGMSPGETKTANIPPEEGYGPHRDELVVEVERDQLPDHIDVEVGQQLQIRPQEGQVFTVSVSEVRDGTVVLDGNHPLAGRELTFDIELIAVA